MIELDSKSLVDLLVTKSSPPWKISPWWFQLISLYEEFQPTIMHTYREANTFADSLANVGVETEGNKVYLTEAELPSAARGCLKLDRLGFPTIRQLHI